MVRMIKPLKTIEKFASEKGLEVEATTERLKEYPQGFHPNYTVKLSKGNKCLIIVSFNTKQFLFDEIDEEGKPLVSELERFLKDAGLVKMTGLSLKW
jgi:hypothetical protein